MRMKAKKILSILLAALILFSPIAPVKVLAVDSSVGPKLIRSGDTIIADGNYQLSNGYKGTITIVNHASKVKVIGSPDGKTLAGVRIAISPRPKALELTIEDLKISAPADKSAIDFVNAPGMNYSIWPFNKSNVDKPAPYYRTDKLLISGDCSLTGGSGGAGVRVGDGVHLIIDKAAGLSDADACLSAQGGENSPGIGGTSGFYSGSVSINGGTITATGGYNSVGIGILTGSVIINGGEVMAISHEDLCPAIGNRMTYMWAHLADIPEIQLMENLSSFVLPGETIVINGGSVVASADNFPGIFAMSGMKDYSHIDAREASSGRLTINGGAVTARGFSRLYTYNAAIMGTQIEINGGTVNVINDKGPGLSGLSTVINGGTVFAVGGAPVDLFAEVASGSLGDVVDDMVENMSEAGAPEEATEALDQFLSYLIGFLFSSNNDGNGSGIAVFPSDSLTINDGTVIAQGGPNSAGIGRAGVGSTTGLFGMALMGNIDFTPGPITINGGSVIATGGKDGAGLGGGGKIYVSGNPTVIATGGGDTAKDVWAEIIKDSSDSARSYLRLEVKDRNSGQPLAGKKVTIAGVPYFSNADGVIGCFIPRKVMGKGAYYRVQITATDNAPQGFPDAITEISPRDISMRSVIALDFPLQNITLQGVKDDDSADDNGQEINGFTKIPLQFTPAFDPLKTDYALYAENKIKSIIVTPEKVAGDAITTVKVNGIEVKAGEAAEVPLQFGENRILVTVSLPSAEWAPDAVPVQKLYSFKVNWENMQITPNELSISIGDTERLIVQYDDSFTGERSGTWSVADSTIISLEESNTEPIRINKKHTIPGTVGAKVTGLKPGTTTVTFTDKKTGARRECAVRVNPDLTITPDPLTVYEGETGSLTLSFDKGYKGSRYGRWTIDDNTIATIDQNGVVTGLKAGTAIATFASGLEPIGNVVRNGDNIIATIAARVLSAYDVVKTVPVVVKPDNCTVTFDTNGGSPIPPSVTVKHDTAVTRPGDPYLYGKRFLGWYTAESGGSKWDFNNDKVTDNMTLYAQWGEERSPSTPSYQAPTITGPDTINLLTGFDSFEQAYSFGGYPAPTYGISPTEPNTANATLEGNTLTILEDGIDEGTYTVTLTATNSAGTTTKTITVNVSPAEALPTITGPDTINIFTESGSIEQEYTFGGVPAPTYGISPDELNILNAALTGNILTIPEGYDIGSYEVTLYATNSVGETTKTVTVNIYYIDISYGIVFCLADDENIIYAIGGAGDPFTYALAPGSSLPEGLTLNEDGTLTATPGLTAGIYDPVSVVISDCEGNSITAVMGVRVINSYDELDF